MTLDPDAEWTAAGAIHLALAGALVRLWPRGAALLSFRPWKDARSIVIGPHGPADLRHLPTYVGAIVGPVANRVRDGRVTIDGLSHQMPANEGTTCLHSGPDGLHARDWTLIERSSSRAKFEVLLADGDCGLPGRRRITADYALSAGPVLTLRLTADTDAPTAMNLAHHPYWTLGADDLGDHRLCIDAPRYLPVDENKLPTGEIAPVKDTPFDFTEARPVPLTDTLDHNFCLAEPPSDAPRLAATLTAGARILRLSTTETGLQVYNGFGLPRDPAVGLEDGRRLGPCAGIALEPQGWPDAPNHPAFPSVLLRPGTTYRQVTVYDLSGTGTP